MIGELAMVTTGKYYFAERDQGLKPEEIEPAAIFHDVERILG